KLLRVFLHPRGRVSLRIDGHRYEENVAADAVAKRFLNLLHVAIHRRTHRSATGEESVDYDSLAFEHVGVEAHLLAVLIDQLDVSKVLLCRFLCLCRENGHKKAQKQK